MPHAVFIASKMATMRRLAPTEYEEVDEEEDDLKSFTITSPSTFRPISSPRLGASTSSGPHLHLPHPVPLGAFDLNAPRLTPEERQRATEESKLEGSEIAEKPSLACVRAHLGHAVAGAFSLSPLNMDGVADAVFRIQMSREAFWDSPFLSTAVS